MQTIKYRYALDQENNLIDVQSLEQLSIDRNRKFFSVDFKELLIARLGEKRAKHFAHKPKIQYQGNKETYLHALGKKVFLEVYKECLNSSTPFKIRYLHENICNRLEEKLKIVCSTSEWREFDLTSYFTQIKVEKKDGKFIPDLLLINPDNGEKIYIEIAVTHFSSDEKIESSQRIIEFALTSEDDIEEIKKFRDEGESYLAHPINFNLSKKKQAFCKKGECNRKFYYFTVSNSGKCRLFVEKESEIIRIRHNSQKPIYSIVEAVSGEPYGGAMFKYFLAKTHKENVKVKNCFLCRYHAISNGKRLPIFCKFLKKEYKSNQASECEFYRIDDDYIIKYLNYPYVLEHGYPNWDDDEKY